MASKLIEANENFGEGLLWEWMDGPGYLHHDGAMGTFIGQIESVVF